MFGDRPTLFYCEQRYVTRVFAKARPRSRASRRSGGTISYVVGRTHARRHQSYVFSKFQEKLAFSNANYLQPFVLSQLQLYKQQLLPLNESSWVLPQQCQRNSWIIEASEGYSAAWGKNAIVLVQGVSDSVCGDILNQVDWKWLGRLVSWLIRAF